MKKLLLGATKLIDESWFQDGQLFKTGELLICDLLFGKQFNPTRASLQTSSVHQS
jgi:hypothetical protein